MFLPHAYVRNVMIATLEKAKCGYLLLKFGKSALLVASEVARGYSGLVAHR